MFHVVEFIGSKIGKEIMASTGNQAYPNPTASPEQHILLVYSVFR
jgi:hypothetical protein